MFREFDKHISAIPWIARVALLVKERLWVNLDIYDKEGSEEFAPSTFRGILLGEEDHSGAVNRHTCGAWWFGQHLTSVYDNEMRLQGSYETLNIELPEAGVHFDSQYASGSG
ncbi:UNVERIFIED_CONTAM: hypothetical protein Sindi_0476800 [Sesamum indicum]